MKYKESLKIIVEAIEQLDKVHDYFEDNDYKSAGPNTWSDTGPDGKNRTSKDGYLVLFTYAGALVHEMGDIFKSVDLGYEANSFYESLDNAVENDVYASDIDVFDNLTLGELKHTLKGVDKLILFLEKTEKLLEQKISIERNFQSISRDSLNKAYIAYGEGDKADGDFDEQAKNMTDYRVYLAIGDENDEGSRSYTHFGPFFRSLCALGEVRDGVRHVIDSDVYDDLTDVVNQILDNGELIFDRERAARKWLESGHDDAMEVIEEIIEQLDNQL